VLQWNEINQTKYPTINKNETLISDFPANLQWFMVPDRAPKTDLWTIEVLAAFYDYRIEKIVVLVASNMAELLRKHNHSKYEFWCWSFYKSAASEYCCYN